MEPPKAQLFALLFEPPESARLIDPHLQRSPEGAAEFIGASLKAEILGIPQKEGI